MGRWFVGQRDSEGRLGGIGCDDIHEAYQECEALNRGWASFLGAQDDVGENPYKVYDLNDEMENDEGRKDGS